MNYNLKNKDIQVNDAELDELILQREKSKEVKVRPSEGDIFYHITSKVDSNIDERVWTGYSEIQKECWDLGNGFWTKEEAQKELDIRLARQRIKDYIKKNRLEFVPEWEDFEQNKFYIYYRNYTPEFIVCSNTSSKWDTTFCFSSESHTQQVIDNCEEDLKIVWGIK